MLFHSYTFLAFLVVVLVLYEILPVKSRRYLLLVSSYIFYGSWDARYALLIALSTVIDFVAAKKIERSLEPGKRKFWLIVSLVMNLGVLGIFKYYNFFADSLGDSFSLHLPLHHLLLPVGISFYTFQSMSYTIDIYRKKIDLAKDLVDFALYVSFFPQLVAGPIVRAAEFLPQLANERVRDIAEIRLGLKLFGLGLFKKLVIADNLARLVDQIHSDPTAFSSGDLWVGAYAFAFQIYFDFSGYSEMAIGIAHLFGFKFPDNFRRPYCSKNISEFWRRWHISLSAWLRDYLYISLGGNRGSTFQTISNLMTTMVLGGLWHGANWTFLLWGFLHGFFLGIHRIFVHLVGKIPSLRSIASSPALTPAYIVLTFHCWVISMVYFRADSIAVANGMLSSMFFRFDAASVTQWGFLGLCVFLFLLQQTQEQWDLVELFDNYPLFLRVAIVVSGIWAIVLLTPKGNEPFLYFQF